MTQTNPFGLDAPAATVTHTPPPVAAPNPYAAPAAAPVPAFAPGGAVPPAQFSAPAPAPVAAQAPTTMPGGGDPFGDPAAQLPRGPRLRDMYGRLVLIIPIKVEYGIPNRLQPGTTQDRMTADVVILDGGPIAYGGAPEKVGGAQHDKTAQVPHVNKAMYISSAGLISQSREALAKRQQGQPGMVLGRLAAGNAKDPSQSPPWLLTPPTDADKAIARQYLAQVDPFA